MPARSVSRPPGFYVQRDAHDTYVERFTRAIGNIQVGAGLDEATQMGPMCHSRRVEAMELFVADALTHGGKIMPPAGSASAPRATFSRLPSSPMTFRTNLD